MCLKNYWLDPAHYYTAPGLDWQALLKTAAECCEHEIRREECELCPDKFRLQQLTDINMLLIFEKGIHGGITQAVKRYAKGNKKYMNKPYNPDRVSIYLQYLDINNEYGKTMTQDLPTHGFKWKEGEGFTPQKIDELVKKKGKEGYLLEVDVEYPKELHENHDDVPFLTERMKLVGWKN